MKLVFWMKEFNYHWVDTLKCIYPLINERIIVVVQKGFSENRMAIGWSAKEEKEYSTIVIPASNWNHDAAKFIRENKEAIHFFQGFLGGWCSRYFLPLIIRALRARIKTVLMIEHYSASNTGYHRDEPFVQACLKAKLRPITYKLAAKLIQANAKENAFCMLALSQTARNQMEKAGFSGDIIFPFGYFVKEEKGIERVKARVKEPLNVVYVGSLLKIKGIDIAIDALSEINSDKVRVKLDIYGPGELGSPLQKQKEFVTYKGILPQSQVQRTIAGYDLLLLPSRHDGWGVVVNEALLQGVPVVVSDQVGASCLVQASQSGLIFASGDREELKKQVLLLLDDHHLLAELQRNAQKAARTISPGIAANYLFDVLNFYYFSYRTGKRPVAIWY